LIAVVLGFLFVTPLPGVTSGALNWTARTLYRALVDDPDADYSQAIERAAIKRQEDRRPLVNIDSSQPRIRLVTFHDERELPVRDRTFSIWAALPDQLKAACKGAQDPVRRLQEVLGLPMRAADKNVVTELELTPNDVFRPCASEASLGDQECDFAFPKPATEEVRRELVKLQKVLDQNAGNDQADGFRQAVNQLSGLAMKYDRLYFFSKQIWTSYQAKSGTPFTGMGWTFDWKRSSKDHVGVSEFVIKPDAVIAKISDTKPADFCR
jgi:hypothetical protein